MSPRPARGDVWLAQLDPARGHEQAGTRPVVVISTDAFNSGAAGLVVVVPMTTTYRNVPWYVEAQPPEGGVRRTSYIKCEDIRSISRERLIMRWGTVSRRVLAEIEDRLRILLEL